MFFKKGLGTDAAGVPRKRKNRRAGENSRAAEKDLSLSVLCL